MEDTQQTEELDEQQSAAIYGGRAAETPADAADDAAEQAADAADDKAEEPEEEADDPGMWQPVRGFLEGRRASVWD